jgi:hypothetical protein
MSKDFFRLQFMHEAAEEHPTPLFSSISFRSSKDVALISLNLCSVYN